MTNNTNIDPIVLKRAESWLDEIFDKETKKQVRELMTNNPVELTDSFYCDLEFGTGGLRGIMGVGTNRMNKYTVGMATQGLANYLKKMFPSKSPIKMAISFDSRLNSQYFARIVAEVLSGNGILVYLFDGLRPTPVLSYAIRYLHCQSGVMITASHNPKEYNGYKAYWEDGGQMIAPHDKNVILEVQKITNVADVKWESNEKNIYMIGKAMDEAYLHEVKQLSLSEKAIWQQQNMQIVYTPLHGTGTILIPEILKRYGFRNISVVKEQSVPDGNFPTVRSPNPEEPDALKMAIEQAKDIDADLVLATDPDADRVGIAVKNYRDEFVLLNGNQTAAILFYYILTKWKENRLFKGNEFIVKTIVTTELLRDIATYFGVKSFDVLTGFKFIADIIRQSEGVMKFIVGGEESYGYLVGDFVRDKDAVSACAMIAEAAAWSACRGKKVYDILIDIYLQFAFYKEKLLSVTKKGKTGAGEIKQMMIDYRENPPAQINNSRVVVIKDYLLQQDRNLITGEVKRITFPKSDVLQFFCEDGSKISIRPSGTEPKIKFYFGVSEKLMSREDLEETEKRLNKKIADIITFMNLS